MAELSITAERLNALKQKIKNEMKRRSATEHSASLSSYGDSSWDFSKELQCTEPITDEHVQKVIDPLLEVNDFLYDNSFRKDKSGLEQTFYKAEQFVDELSKVTPTDSNSGCRGSCTGLCTEACTGACTGCTSCTGGCSTSCGNTCGDNCGGGCSGCTTGCHTGCTNTCGSGCTSGLKS